MAMRIERQRTARRIGAVLVLLLACSAAADPAVVRVARVGDQEIALSEIDERGRGGIDSPLEQLAATARQVLEALIDERLLADGEPPHANAVIDANVESFLATHPEYFRGPGQPSPSPAEVEIAKTAARRFLEGRTRQEARVTRLERLRAATEIERSLPPASALVQPLDAEIVVGRVAGDPIRGDELERAGALPLYAARRALYAARARRLEAAVEARLLAELARLRGVGQAELLRDAPVPAIDAAAIDAFRVTETAAGHPEPTPAKARARLELSRRREATEHSLAAAREVIPVEILLEPPAPARLPVLAEDGPSLGGDADAPTLVVYANYRCTPCRRLHEQIDRLLAQDPPPRVVLRDFLEEYDPPAHAASVWLRCAAAQGRHAQLRKLLLQSPPSPFAAGWLRGASPQEIALRIGARPEAFTRCAAAPQTAAAIERDGDEARRLGFAHPPALVVEGRPFSAPPSDDDLREALRQSAD